MPEDKKQTNPLVIMAVIVGLIILFMIQPIFAFIAFVILSRVFKFNGVKDMGRLISKMTNLKSQPSMFPKQEDNSEEDGETEQERPSASVTDVVNLLVQPPIKSSLSAAAAIRRSFLFHYQGAKKLERRKKYLQIALNGTMADARAILYRLPQSDRIIVEAGTPLLKIYGTSAISEIRGIFPDAYIVADNKCADLGSREVEIMARAGANAATCLGVAPIETIDSFVAECQRLNIDSMIDMMNVDQPLAILKKLKNPPTVVVLHRGVDESEFSKEKQIPYYQIKQVKGGFDTLISVAGGDTTREVQRAFFNDADIVVVWKNFYQVSSDTASLAEGFLKEVK